ncbi:MAG: MMPL family transporter [Planctomycetota bacterium]|nr:MMPL family transporter [Planctomycetota bacterium]
MGNFIYRFRWQIVALWVAAAAGLTLLAPGGSGRPGLTSDLLPADSPSRVGLDEMARRFADETGRSHAIVVFERDGGPLTDADRTDIESVAALLTRPRPGGPGEDQFRGARVRSPASLAAMGASNPLLSPDSRAAMIVVALPYNFATARAVAIVEHVHAVLAGISLRPGLAAAVTGSAGFGRDHLQANEHSHDKILFVTIAAVIAILLAVYRAPVAAIIPLLAISLASLVATKLTLLGRSLGLGSGTAERLFMLVLIYGAGVDYSLLFISRYKEFLDELRPPGEALAAGLNASLAAIVASAAMTAAGLGMLCFARFGVFRDVGPAIVLGLVIAGAAAVTLVPALVALAGPRTFWPRRTARLEHSLAAAPAGRPRRFWPHLADLVLRHPGLVFAAAMGILLIPAARGASLSWDYDAQASLDPRYDAVRGSGMVSRHWSLGEIAPVTVLAVSPSPQTPEAWRQACGTLTARVRRIRGAGNVRSLVSPLGLNAGPIANAAAHVVAIFSGDSRAREQFLSSDGHAMRLFVTLQSPPQTVSAMATAAEAGSVARAALAGIDARVHLTGPTAETADLRAITQADFYRMAILALGVIFLIVSALLRDVLLAAFMVAATALGYAATLGLTYWLVALAGQGGLDWEVEVFLFIVMVAVGQDYNVFFTVRLAQESLRQPGPQAVGAALVRTGPVISSCGLIMAATLGSLLAGDVRMLQQLGLALALGMLIDTFLVRPLLLPAFILLTGRTLRRAAAFLR